MKLEMRGQMRLEQKMKLAPHMIQSMEILQLPILALQERIEQELNSNPVLEIDEPLPETTPSTTEQSAKNNGETDSTTEAGSEKIEDFGRLENLDDDYKEHIDQAGPYRTRIRRDEPDAKLEAIKNTAARPHSLHEYLSEQWRLIDADEPVKKAGDLIIDYIDDRGYLRVRLEQLHSKDRTDFTFEDLTLALSLVQQLEPAGVGARDLRECLLIQIGQNGSDMDFVAHMVSEHMDELLDNRLPEIAKKMHCSVGQINKAISRLARLDTSPGLQVSQARNHNITVDVIVEPLEDSKGYNVRLADSSLPALRISDLYVSMSKDADKTEKTKQFLQNNIRSARWIIDAIAQRKNTLLKVARAVVKYQKDFFDKGQLHLRPLPMSKVADEVGVHLATVSRAVAGKYVQCHWGILPLRKFFSGGTEDANGQARSWEAIRAKLQQIIDEEDKTKPLSDDKIRQKLAEAGIENLARRTIAKYRNILNIPAARFRKKY